MLRDPNIDFVIRGEGERPLVEFLRVWMDGHGWDGVSNLGFKRNGKLILNQRTENFQIEEIPFPDLSDFTPRRYRLEGRPLSVVISSRGCPQRCAFCSSQLTFGRVHRKRSPEDVLREIKQRYAEGYRVFDFEDDNLVCDTNRMKVLCKRLIDAFPLRDVRFLAMNGVFILSLDRELLGLMRRAGFTHLDLSLVSGDHGVCQRTKRPYLVAKYVAVVQEAVRLGFKIVSYQILGLPYDTLNNMIQTLSLGARLPVLLGPSMFYLAPGCPMSRDFGRPTDEDLLKSRLTAMAIETGDVTREDLYTLFVTIRIINFLKGIRSDRQRMTLREALHLAGGQGERSVLGVELLGRLLAERKLSAATKDGFKLLRRFKTALFFSVWTTLGQITTQEGKTIRLG
jgi:radical SAM superfamily enzyme YgiQ (UPF0313 family)